MAQIDSYIPVCDAIARLHAPYVEVVLHDLRTDTIHYIANCFSKRRAGDSSLNDVGDIDRAASIIGPYSKTNWDGRRLRSITTVIRNDEGAATGLLCINQDVEAVSGLLEQLTGLLGPPAPMTPATALFAGDWRERINEHVGAFLASRNATLAGLMRADINDLIAHLDRAGLFEIRNALPYVADTLSLSRATLYNRLKKIREHAPRETTT
jgi:D-arginine utilization repressor